MPETARVLVANVPGMDDKIRDCLPGHDLTFIRTMHEALRALRHDGYTLVVIGLEFDDSRMLELLQYVRTLPKYREVPIVCVYAKSLSLSDAAIRNIEVAVKALGGLAFLDLGGGVIDYKRDCAFLDRVAMESGTSIRPN